MPDFCYQVQVEAIGTDNVAVRKLKIGRIVNV